jgi:hypothetical protein
MTQAIACCRPGGSTYRAMDERRAIKTLLTV